MKNKDTIYWIVGPLLSMLNPFFGWWWMTMGSGFLYEFPYERINYVGVGVLILAVNILIALLGFGVGDVSGLSYVLEWPQLSLWWLIGGFLGVYLLHTLITRRALYNLIFIHGDSFSFWGKNFSDSDHRYSFQSHRKHRVQNIQNFGLIFFFIIFMGYTLWAYLSLDTLVYALAIWGIGFFLLLLSFIIVAICIFFAWLGGKGIGRIWIAFTPLREAMMKILTRYFKLL